MADNENHRETGATKYTAKESRDASDQVSQEAAENKKPRDGMGLTRPQGEVNDKTHQSDGENLPAQPGGPSKD
jgi:hypothetical protein